MLVGRDRELAALAAGIEQLAAGRGALFLLAGEPGIGKTRLASELAAVADGVGMRVAWGRCWEAGGAPAYWPWQEALAGLGLALPEGSGVVAADPAQARFALFRDIAGRLVLAAPCVIVLEDLHAADHSSVLLLEFLATHLRSVPILVVGTYRDFEARLRPEIGDVVARAGRAGTVLGLARLREHEVAAVVRDGLEAADDRLIANVFETTHGNPLFVSEIVRQIRAGEPTGAIPLGVREIIRQRLGLVAAAARHVLDAGAVLGVELGVAELARMVPDAAPEIDAAIASGLLTRRGERVRFAHALYREALYHDLPIVARQALHRDAARALAATGAPAAEVAHHMLEGGADAAVQAIDQAIVAARAALDAFAFEDAAALLERARLAIPAGQDEATLRARVAIALGEVRLRGGDAKGRELCVEGARIARELGDATLLALAGLAYGSVFLMGGVDGVMVGMLEEALDRLSAGDSGLRARTMARLAAARQPSAMPLRARDIALALAAVDMGRRVATRRELLEILQSAGGALYGAADPSDRIGIARQQAQLAEELGDAPRLIAAYVRLAMDHLELADIAGYEQVAVMYERTAARFGAAAGKWRVPLMRSMVALARDDFAASQRHQDEAAQVDIDNPRARRARGLHRICFLRAAERHDELRRSLDELRSLWMELPVGRLFADVRVASVFARIGAEDEARALLATIPIEAIEEEINSASLAEVVWITRDTRVATVLASKLRRYATRWMAYWLDVEIAEMPGDRALAFALAVLGDWTGADAHFDRAMDSLRRVGRRASIARMQFEYGDLLVRSGRDLDRARGLLAEAHAGAAELGLAELVALVDRRHPAVSAASPRLAPATARVLTMVREGEVYAVTTASSTLRFKATRGMHYLAQLVEQPGKDIHVLELVGSQDADRGDAGEVVDARALRAYRERAEKLREIIEDADTRRDSARAERARSELEALAVELSRGTALGGKTRRSESVVDRARSAVQRRIKDAIDRIAEADAELGAWLRRVIRTGNTCCFIVF
jgi:hypothetical protein